MGGTVELGWLHGLAIAPLAVVAWWALTRWMNRKDSALDRLTEAVGDVRERLTRIEAKLPNGELGVILFRMGEIEKKLETVLNHVDEHNREADDWKRRIMVLEGKAHGGI